MPFTPFRSYRNPALLWALGAAFSLPLSSQTQGLDQTNDPTPTAATQRTTADDAHVSPEDYVYWHSLALVPDAETGAGKTLLQIMLPEVKVVPWEQAMAKLAEIGDDYTLHLLKRVESVDPKKSTTIQTTRERIEARLAKASTNQLSTVLRARLERAALADVTCAAIEGDLCPWVRKSISPHHEDPMVRAALLEIANAPLPPQTTNDTKERMRQRARVYAQSLLNLSEIPGK